MKKKLTYIPLAAILAALLLSSCTQPPAPASGASSSAAQSTESSSQGAPEPGNTPEAVSILEQMDALYAQLDTAPLPQQENGLWLGYIDLAKGTLEHLPPQLIKNEPRAYELAQQIRAVLFPQDNLPYDFTSLEEAYRPALLQTAIYHTAPLDLNWSWDAETNTLVVSTYQDHVISALLKNELTEGRYPTAAYSGQDVRATMRTLYGDELDYADMDVSPYYYYAREDVYFQMGDWGGPMWRYPQITAYTETDETVVCEAVIIYALDKETPLEENGTVLTPQNFESLTAKYPKFRLTFTKADDGRLTLSAWQTLRKAAE